MSAEPVSIAEPPPSSCGHPLPSPKSVTSRKVQPDRTGSRGEARRGGSGSHDPRDHLPPHEGGSELSGGRGHSGLSQDSRSAGKGLPLAFWWRDPTFAVRKAGGGCRARFSEQEWTLIIRCVT